ncbi:Septum formation protein Maf [bacterium HR21]|nr:Septum formation protein Maf [bacterium HR21]
MATYSEVPTPTPASLLRLKRPLVLASQSPRRAELLRLLGIEFRVQPAPITEPDDSAELSPGEYVLQLARAKALAVAQHLCEPALVLGADTTVVLGGQYLNKPRTPEAAAAMLAQLSGRTHEVYTGVVLLRVPELDSFTGVARAEVTFRKLQPEEIAAYVATGSPLDKAGAYGIQDPFGAVFVEHLRGCYYAVVGLPLALLYQLLRQACDAP